MATRAAKDIAEPRRSLPGVDAFLRSPELAGLKATLPHDELVACARAVLAAARTELHAGAPPPSLAALAARLEDYVQHQLVTLPAPVINATGVIINTNLGRSPLSQSALAAIHAVAGDYAALEYDLDAGTRGSRNEHPRKLLRDLIGAEDSLVVNNAAAALLLILATVIAGERREVIVSRGQLVEIGGGFRIPDVLRQSGARLVEVGTTNRTRSADFAQAITPLTAMILLVHASNFRMVGFTESPGRDELALLAHTHGLPLVEDLGSGCLLDTTPYGLAREPRPQDAIAAGVDVVCFSGDKLLGGPQAGLIAGKSAAIQAMATHPLMRALRVDKVTLAGLIATLRSYQRGRATEEIPIWRMIAQPVERLHERAVAIVNHLRSLDVVAATCAGVATIGGGSLPGSELPTWLVTLPVEAHGDLDALARRLRLGSPPIVARIAHDQLVLDLRTVPAECDAALIAAVQRATASASHTKA